MAKINIPRTQIGIVVSWDYHDPRLVQDSHSLLERLAYPGMTCLDWRCC